MVWRVLVISVYYFLLHIITPKLGRLKHWHSWPDLVSEGQESESSLVGWFWIRISPEVVAKLSEGLTGARRSASKLAHSGLLAEGFRSSLPGPPLRASHNMSAHIKARNPSEHKASHSALWCNHIQPLAPSSIVWSESVSPAYTERRGLSLHLWKACQRFLDMF